MNPEQFAHEVQSFASGLAQDTLDLLELYRVENEAAKRWYLDMAKLLQIDPDQYRNFADLRARIRDVVRYVLTLSKQGFV